MGLAATLGADDLDEDDEEELKFYEQLQVQRASRWGGTGLGEGHQGVVA